MKEHPPVTCSLGVIGPLLGKLYSLVEAEQSLPEEVSKDDLQSLIQDLEETRNSVTELSKEEDASFTAKCLMKDMREICYDVEDYLDTVLHANASTLVPEDDVVSELKARLLGARRRRERCQKKIFEMKARLQQDEGFQSVVESMLQNPHEVLDKPMMNKLVDLLALDSEQQLKVVPILGPAGVGKTTLARILYHSYGGRFQCRAFLRVSRNPDTRRILTSMLAQIKGARPQGSCSVQYISNKVNKHLRGKTYLIVVDDLWATSAWDIISRAFPKGDHYSRIITTTQIENVALACCSFCSNSMYEMRPHSDGQPRELFFGTSERMTTEVLDLIYKNLPAHLKTCLLYLNMYPEDYVILRDDLAKQWVAEGFIGAAEGEKTEELAISYFDELVARRTIQPVETNYNNEVLSCTVHHMVLDLIARKSIEDNFITVVEDIETLPGFPDKVRRLSLKFGGAKGADVPGTLRVSQVRSFLFSGFFRCVPSIVEYRLIRVLILDVWADQDEASYDLNGIRELFLLRYLKVACNITVTLPEQMEGLQLLEALELDARVDAVPSDIALLQRLVHLRLLGCTALAHGIGQMISLRTLGYFDLSSNLEKNVLNLGQLTNLQDLHLTCSIVPSGRLVRNLVVMGSILKRLRTLKSLTLVPGFSQEGTIESETSSSSSMTISCDGLSMVTSPPELLEKLDLFPRNCIFSRLPEWIKHLDKLCILKVAVRELSPSSVDLLKGLHTLIALSLHVQVAPANSIVIGQEEFPVLRCFTFRCALVCVSFHKGAMPNVQRLKLGFCVDKEGLASYANAGLEHLCSLREISAKVWPAGVGDLDRRVVEESCLKAAISKSVSPPIVNIKCVDRVSYGGKYYRSEEQQDGTFPAYDGELEESSLPSEAGASHDLGWGMSKDAPDDMMCIWTTSAPHLIPFSSPDTVEEACSSYGDGMEEEEGFLRRWNSSSSLSSSAMTTNSLYAFDEAMRVAYAAGEHVVQVYVDFRRRALAESVVQLGIKAIAMEDVLKMEWSVLDQNMRRWSHGIGIVVRTFLAEERRLCDEVFKSNQELGHRCFTDIARGCILQLLGFADAVAVSAHATERLYRTLAMYEALAGVRPELEALFSGDAATREFFAGEVSSTVEQLGSALRHTIEEFGRAIHGEASRKAVHSHSGEIHPMTRYVVNYCALLADSRSTLDAVLGDAGLDDDEDAGASSTDGGSGGTAASTPSARCIRELLTLLLGKVDEKARLYRDAGLQNIFLMNNVYYVVQKVRESPPLRELLGDDWLRRHLGQIRQYEGVYLRASWMAVLSTHLRNGGPSAKGFNAAFQELYRVQTAWKVTDPQLREELRIAVLERLIPAYRAFLGQGTRHPARHVKCSLEDLEVYMLDFFEGVPKSIRW
ncbi:unnamed protein product [Urochloa decumbens]